jgi:hypothetical protein
MIIRTTRGDTDVMTIRTTNMLSITIIIIVLDSRITTALDLGRHVQD